MDKARLSTARTELSNVLESEDLRSVPLLIFANKQDINGALKPDEIERELQLSKICSGVKQRDFAVRGCCGVTGEGLTEGLLWLGDRIREYKRNYPRINN